MKLLCTTLAILVLFSAQAQAAAPSTPPAARNCGLAAPPPGAGVDRHMAALLRIHPRNPDIGPNYTGCQTLWAQDGDDWAVVTVAHYEAGHVAWIESPLVERDPMAECRLKDGVVTHGDPELCAQLDEMRFESAPAACLDRQNEAGARGRDCERR
jgi:hypothetical protein